MIPALNKIIEKYLKRDLHARENEQIQKGLVRFGRKFPQATEAQKTEVKLRLEKETTRLFPLADKSILNANLVRSMMIFWFIALLGTSMTLLQGNWPGEHLLAFLAPVLSAFFTWCISCLSISVLYNQRIEGGMNSTVATFAMEHRLTNGRTQEFHSPERAQTSSPALVMLGLGINALGKDPEAIDRPLSPSAEVEIVVEQIAFSAEPHRPICNDGCIVNTP